MTEILAFGLLFIIISLLAGPSYSLWFALTVLLAKIWGDQEYERGRKDQEAIDDVKTAKKIEVTHERARQAVLAARGVDGVHHHEVTIREKDGNK